MTNIVVERLIELEEKLKAIACCWVSLAFLKRKVMSGGCTYLKVSEFTPKLAASKAVEGKIENQLSSAFEKLE